MTATEAPATERERVLREIMLDEDARGSDRVSAARELRTIAEKRAAIPKKKKRRQWAQMKPITFLRAQIGELGEDLHSAREAGSHQAARDYRRMLEKAHGELAALMAADALAATEGGVPAGSTPGDILGILDQVLDVMPADQLDAVHELILARRPELRAAFDAHQTQGAPDDS